MDKKRYLSLYIGNHGKSVGIEDYIAILTKLFGDRGIHLKVAYSFDPNAVNLVIDEFTNYLENHRIATFKKLYPDSRIIFILTEFSRFKWGVKSLNNFGNIFDAAAITAIDVYLRKARDDFRSITVGSLIKLACYSPLLLTQMLGDTLRSVRGRIFGNPVPNAVAKFQERHHRKIYFHMRYLGLMACLRHADALITSHDKIINGFSRELKADGRRLKYFGVIYPEIDEQDVLEKLMVDKKLFVEITGSVTPYRQHWIDHTNQQLLTLGMHHVFGYCMSRPFSVHPLSTPVDQGAYSLHPPQTRHWPYCSPTRIFRALSVDYNLPVLTQHFHQNPIEDVCLLFEGQKSIIDMYEMYTNNTLLRKFIEPKIRTYNKLAKGRNDKMAEKLVSMMDDKKPATDEEERTI